MDIFKNFRRKAPAEIALHIGVSAIFMVVAFSYLYILIWAFLAGVRSNTEIVMHPFALPTKWNWRNYIDVFRLLEVNGTKFSGMLFNSVYFSVLGPLISQFVTCTFAYTCFRYKFPGSTWPRLIILVIITLPIYGTGGAMYMMQKNMGLINNYARIVLSAGGMNLAFLYYSAYYKNISKTYIEASMMDGANDFQTYFRVMLPQAKPLFGALYLSSWLSVWNSYSDGLIYYPKLPTLPVGIYLFNEEMIYRARLDILFAACVLICIPAIVLFLVFNKTITTNVSLGGLKG